MSPHSADLLRNNLTAAHKRIRELETHVAELEKDNEIIKASEVEAHDENRRLMAEVERLRQCHSTIPPPAQCQSTPEK